MPDVVLTVVFKAAFLASLSFLAWFVAMHTWLVVLGGWRRGKHRR